MLRTFLFNSMRLPLVAVGAFVIAGCSQAPGPHWRIAIENDSDKAVKVAVEYTVDGGAAPGKHTAEDDFDPKKNVELASGDGKVTVHSAVFSIGNRKARADGGQTANPRQTVIITLSADEKVAMRVE